MTTKMLSSFAVIEIYHGVNIDYKRAVKIFLELNPRKLKISSLIFDEIKVTWKQSVSIQVSLMKYQYAVSSYVSVIIASFFTESSKCNTPLIFLKFVGILTKYVGKTSWPNVFGKSGLFCHKKWNEEFYQYPLPQKSNFYWRWRIFKKFYKICTDDYDNYEHLAVKYIRFFTNDIIWCLQCNVYR